MCQKSTHHTDLRTLTKLAPHKSMEVVELHMNIRCKDHYKMQLFIMLNLSKLSQSEMAPIYRASGQFRAYRKVRASPGIQESPGKSRHTGKSRQVRAYRKVRANLSKLEQYWASLGKSE